MAYKKFSLYFKCIDQIVNKIITMQFTPFPVADNLAHFCASNLSLFKLLQMCRFYKLHFTVTFFH